MAQGVKTGGRKKGTPNKTTALLKEAIIKAAQEVGSDGRGEGGLTGYCQHLATTEPKAFAGLLGRVLPYQVVGDADEPIITRIELVAGKAENPGSVHGDGGSSR